jgi:Asp-tRNA(Asn)/Glu-tRNA(Gln) amidotransferase A subunit family amidase
MFTSRPTIDTVGPMTRTVRDAAVLLGVIAGYDPKDRVTAYAVGHIPKSFTSALHHEALKGARLGVIRQPMHSRTDPTSSDYKAVHVVIDRALSEVKALGAHLVEPVTIADVADRITQAYDGNVFETESAVNAYLAEHRNAPARTLRDILLSGKALPWRTRGLMNSVGRSTDDPGYARVQRITEETRRLVLALMADHQLDALVYATADHSPETVAPDVMTNPDARDSRLGSNRTLASIIGFPAITVPAGFTAGGLPVGLEFMARPFTETTLLGFAYAYEQSTRHRKPPPLRDKQ